MRHMQQIYCRNLFLCTPLAIRCTDYKLEAAVTVNVTTLAMRI